MSDKYNITKMVSKMHKKETKEIAKKLEKFVQPNLKIDYMKILKNKPKYISDNPIFSDERLQNLKIKKSNLNLEFLNKSPIITIYNQQRIVEDNNGLLFNKIDPVKNLDNKVTYSHYDTSIDSFNKRIIEKTGRKFDAIPDEIQKEERYMNKIFGSKDDTQQKKLIEKQEEQKI